MRNFIQSLFVFSRVKYEISFFSNEIVFMRE